MDEVKILEIKQSVFKNNDNRAELLRKELKQKGVFLLNLMSWLFLFVLKQAREQTSGQIGFLMRLRLGKNDLLVKQILSYK